MELMSILLDCNYKESEKMANITNYLNKIKTAVYGKDVRGAIHDAIKQVYDDASVNHDNANMEVKMARGTHNTLNDRLDKSEQKLDETNAQLSVVKEQTDSLNYYVHPNHTSRTTIMERYKDFDANYFRIPFMTVCKDGTIVAGGDIRYNSGADHSYISLGVKRSTDGGKTWTDPVVAIANKDVDKTYSRCMDGTIIYNESLDKLFLLGNSWETGNTGWSLVTTEGRDTNWDILLATSIDKGKTWSSPVSLAHLLPNGYNAFIGGVGQGITMSNGTMVFPIQINPSGKSSGDGRTRSGIIYSTDGGNNWSISSSFTDMPCSECMVIEWSGALWLNCRSDNNSHRMIYKSTDMGTTWTYIQNLSEVSTMGVSCQGSMITVPYGQNTYVLSSNPKEKISRTKLTVSVLNESVSDWVQTTTIIPWSFDGYSCLAYDKWNQKLYIIFESASLYFEDVSYILPRLKELSSQGENSTDKSYLRLGNSFASIYIDVVNGSDANEGGSISKPVKTFYKVSEIARKYKVSQVYLMQSDVSSVDLELSNIPGTIHLNLINASGVPYVSVGGVYIRGCGDVRFNFNTRFVRPLKSNDRYYGLALEDSKIQTGGQTFQFPLYVTPETGVTAYYMVYADGSLYSPTYTTFYDVEEGAGKIPAQSLVMLDNNKCDVSFLLNYTSTLSHIPRPYILNYIPTYVNHRVNIGEIDTRSYDTYNDSVFKYPLVELLYNHYCSSRSGVHSSIDDTRTVTNVYLNGNVAHYTFNIYFGSLASDIENGTSLFTLPTISRPKITHFITGVAYKRDSVSGKVIGEYGVTLQVRHDTGNVEMVGILSAGVTQIICTGVLA